MKTQPTANVSLNAVWRLAQTVLARLRADPASRGRINPAAAKALAEFGSAGKEFAMRIIKAAGPNADSATLGKAIEQELAGKTAAYDVLGQARRLLFRLRVDGQPINERAAAAIGRCRHSEGQPWADAVLAAAGPDADEAAVNRVIRSVLLKK